MSDQSVPTSVSADATDDDLYAIAWKEIENNDQEKGLWARLYAEYSGNSELLRTAYLKLRVGELGKQREIETNQPHHPRIAEKLLNLTLRKKLSTNIHLQTPQRIGYSLESNSDTTPLIWFIGIIFTVVIVANLIN